MQTTYVPANGQVVTYPDLATARREVPDAPVYWLDLLDPTPEEKESLSALGITPEVLADAMQYEDRPGVKELPETTAVTFRMFRFNEAHELEAPPMHLLINPPVVVSIRPCREQWIEQVQGEIMRHPGLLTGVGRAAYLVLDAVIDGHFPILDRLEDRLEEVDEEILEHASTRALPRINHIKRILITMRRAIVPERDAINYLLLTRPEYLTPEDLDDFRDLHYRTLQALELADTYRDLLGNSLDAYMANVSNRLNEVMKILTIIATVFLPLSFVGSFYGMNFAHTWPPFSRWWSTVIVTGGMAAVAGWMLWYFKRKGWM